MAADAVTVIVLSYNGTADTLACLASLAGDGLADAGRAFKVLVVDNASTDGAPAAIRAGFPDVTMLELPENRGWAGGSNAGIAHAVQDGAGFVCLLNNDTVVPPGAIGGLVAAAQRFAPCLMHPAIDFADPDEGAQIDPGADGSTPLPEDDGVFELDFAYGACLVVPTALFARIGLFDERFFLQMEETDLWLRAKQLGFRSLCQTRVRIMHRESRSFGGRMTPLKTYYIVRNTLLLAGKHHRTPRGALRALQSLYWLAAKLDGRGGAPATLRWMLSRDPHAVAARLGLRDYARRRFGQIGSGARRAIADAMPD